MANNSLVIGSFKYGLDDRRDQLVNQPGTLQTLNNAFVNDGGELEKRQAFVGLFASESSPPTAMTGTLGLLYVPSGFVVFSNTSTKPSGWGVYPTFSTLSDSGIGYSVYVLKHPREVWAATEVTLSAVLFAINFNGYPFVAGKFSDGQVFLYYGGAIIPSRPIDASAMGIVYTGLTNASDLATQLASFVNAANGPGLSGWRAVHTNPTDNYTDIFSPPGVTGVRYSTYSTNDPTRTIAVQHRGDNSPGSPGTAATACLRITATGATGTVFTAKIDATTIGTYTTVASDTVNTVAANLAAAINTTYSTTEATATSAVNLIVVYTTPGDTTANGKTLEITATGSGGVDVPPTTSYVVLNPTYVAGTKVVNRGPSARVDSTAVVANPFGMNAPYTYAWEYVSGNTTVTPTHASQESTTFFATVDINTEKSAIYRCRVTDSSTTPIVRISNNVAISLTCESSA